MWPRTSLLCSLSLIILGCPALGMRADSHITRTCDRIAAVVSNASEVYFPPAPQYLSDISHLYATSSEKSICSVEPGLAEDVSKILCILGSTRTPFAVKGGGRTSNPGFSSTKGVQISMTRFNKIKVDTVSATVEVGAGRTWDQVYAELESYGVNVVGGRVPGVGVAGVALGGGYSWKSNQYGLTVDNILGYELVLPNGTIKLVTPSDADLWFGLRGGLNNFGIVTKFILKLRPQGGTWGGTLSYSPNQLDAFKDAVIRYQDKDDPKATAIFSLLYSSGTLALSAFLFYDAPTPPQGIFDDFLTLPTVQKSISSGSFYNFVSSLGFINSSDSVRLVTGHVPVFDSNGKVKLICCIPSTYWSDVPVTRFSATFLDACVNQINLSGGLLSHLDQNLTIITDLYPVDSEIFSHGSGSAFPPDRSQALSPSVLIYSWSNALLDHTIANAMRNHSDALHNAALMDGQNVSDAAVYVNYALFDTPLEDIYGANLPRLREIRAEVDPEDVMGLAGGFKF